MRCILRVDYGLPQTSLSSLLSSKMTNAQEITQESTNKCAQEFTQKSTKDLQNPQKLQQSKQSKKSSKIQNNQTDEIQSQKISQDVANKSRQTYGMEILELMSDEEYSAFVRASEGMSDGEKLIAAQSLYSLREDYKGQGAPQNAKNPYTKTNRAFGRYNDFLERYKAFYYGVEKVEILG